MSKREIEQFKEHLQETKSGLHHFPYTVNKGKVTIYKIIFISLSFLFVGIGLWLYSSTINWACAALVFENCDYIKTFLTGFCYLCGLVCLIYGLFLKPEQEIAAHFVKRALWRAKKIHQKKMMQFSYERVIAGTYTYNQVARFKRAYHEILDRIHLIENDAMLLIKRISISKVISPEEKEKLYNQAIEELQHQLHAAVHHFYEEEEL